MGTFWEGNWVQCLHQSSCVGLLINHHYLIKWVWALKYTDLKDAMDVQGVYKLYF